MSQGKNQNLKTLLQELAEISNWFESQKELDVEEGLNKVKRAGEIIKQSKERLKEIENEFTEIKEGIEREVGDL